MLLGLSSAAEESDKELHAISGSENGNGGIADGALLASFAEKIHQGSVDKVDRDEVANAVGENGMVDAAAVCANFNMMVRIADGTGTPLDSGTVDMSSDVRDELQLDELVTMRLDQPSA